MICEWRMCGNNDEWLLEHRHYEIRGYRGSPHDMIWFDLYGTVENNFDGTYTAGIPVSYDEETDSDWKELGDSFTCLESAKQAVWKANNPHNGGIFV